MTLKGTSKRFVLICAGVAVVALGGFGYLTWTDMERMEALDEESRGLEAAIRKADAEIRTIPTIENRVLTLREQVKNYVTILPDDAEIHAFVDKLTQFETESGVRVTKLDDTQARQRRASRKKSAQAFESIKYKLTLKGTTQQLLAFMDLLENEYERFVRIPSFRVQAFVDRQVGDEDLEDIERQHRIDLELETYIYNPKKRGAGHVAIRNEDAKLEALRESGALDTLGEDIVLVRHDIEPRPDRRDPFVDPRIVIVRVSEEERQLQEERLRELGRQVADLRGALEDEVGEPNLVKRIALKDANDEFLNKFGKLVNELAEEPFFTAPDLAKEFESEVLGPVRKLMAERGGSGTTMLGVLGVRDIKHRVADMEKAARQEDYDAVVNLHEGVQKLRERYQAPESLLPVFERSDALKEMAVAHLGFRAMGLKFGGRVVYPRDPSRAVVIIDGRSFSPGERVNEGLVIKQITSSEVVFDYMGYPMTHRFGDSF